MCTNPRATEPLALRWLQQLPWCRCVEERHAGGALATGFANGLATDWWLPRLPTGWVRWRLVRLASDVRWRLARLPTGWVRWRLARLASDVRWRLARLPTGWVRWRLVRLANDDVRWRLVVRQRVRQRSVLPTSPTSPTSIVIEGGLTSGRHEPGVSCP